MRCHVCNVAVGDDQKFCHECGVALAAADDPVEPQPVDDADPGSDDDSPDDVSPGVDLNDEVMFAPPAPEDDLPDTGPVEVITATSSRDADGLAPTEAMAVTPPLAPVTAPTPVTPTTPSSASRTNSLDSVPWQQPEVAPVTDDDGDDAVTHERTTAMPIVPADPSTTDGVAPTGPGGVGSTSEMSVTWGGGLFDGASDVQEYSSTSDGFRLRASFVFAVLALGATLLASVADVIDIRTTRPVDGIIVGIRVLDDFGSNLAVAGFIGAGLMTFGALLSCFGLRWGAGLAGGAGLATTGWAAVTLGLVEAPIHAAEGVTLNTPAVAAFTLSVTRDLGYFLVLATGVLGLIVFAVSLRLAGTGGRRGLNPWIAAFGGLAAVVLAAGPLITLGGAPLDANLGTIGIPAEFFAGRLVQLGLIVVAGVFGFLSVRTYGLGLAAGGMSVATWMWVTSLAGIGDLPVSIAVGNLGTTDTTPHAVTTVGVTASLALLLIAATVATVTRRRP